MSIFRIFEEIKQGPEITDHKNNLQKLESDENSKADRLNGKLEERKLTGKQV